MNLQHWRQLQFGLYWPSSTQKQRNSQECYLPIFTKLLGYPNRLLLPATMITATVFFPCQAEAILLLRVVGNH